MIKKDLEIVRNVTEGMPAMADFAEVGLNAQTCLDWLGSVIKKVLEIVRNVTEGMHVVADFPKSASTPQAV